MNGKPQVKFEVIAELAEKIFVQNSEQIGKEVSAIDLARWSFRCAESFLTVKKELEITRVKELEQED